MVRLCYSAPRTILTSSTKGWKKTSGTLPKTPPVPDEVILDFSYFSNPSPVILQDLKPLPHVSSIKVDGVKSKRGREPRPKTPAHLNDIVTNAMAHKAEYDVSEGGTHGRV